MPVEKPLYIPPSMRNNPVFYKSKDLSIKVRQKTKDVIFEKVRQEDYGKADDAWDE